MMLLQGPPHIRLSRMRVGLCLTGGLYSEFAGAVAAFILAA